MSWCSCFPTIISPIAPCSNGGDCVRAPHMLITAENSVGPCAETGVIPITNKVLLSSDCATPVYKIISTSVNLTGVTIDADEVTFTSAYNPATEGSSHLTAQIKYRVFCGTLSDTGTIDIIFKSNCTNTVCESDEVCDPCTGACVAETVDISVSGSDDTSIDIQIT